MGETEDYQRSATPTAHASTHEDGGSDEISVDGLAGQLLDDQPSTWTLVSGKPTSFTPAAHKTSHQDAGTDEISVQGLAGTLADNQPSTWALVSGKPTTFTPEAHKTSHQDGGSDEISVQGLSGTLADAQTPAAHKTSHQDGGTDEISIAGLSGKAADPQTPDDTAVKHSLATTESDFLVASGAGAFVKKTLAETLAILSGAAQFTYAIFNGVGGVTIGESFDISGIVRDSAGIYTVSFSSARPNANYVVLVSWDGTQGARFVQVRSQTTTGFQVRLSNLADTQNIDDQGINVIVFCDKF